MTDPNDLALAAFRAAPVASAVVAVPEVEAATFLMVNRAFCELARRDDHEILTHATDEVLPDAGALLTRPKATASRKGCCRRPDGTSLPVMLGAASLDPGFDGTRRIVLQVTEIPGLDAPERPQLESEWRAQDLIDSAGALIYIKSIDGKFILVNRHFEDM
ncbi:MAG: hypothetical protein ACRDK8_05855, partial [Solirubrobacteraceae bacterium]